MKAFSPDIFTEYTQASLKEEAYKVINQNPETIRSLLEAEDDSILMEMDARREMYLSLLESQQQDLGIIDEAGLGGKVIALIIAGIVAVITAVIALISGKGGGGGGGGGSIPSPAEVAKKSQDLVKGLAKAEKNTNDAIKSSDTYKNLDSILNGKDADKILSDVDKIGHRGKKDHDNLGSDYHRYDDIDRVSIDQRVYRKVHSIGNYNPYWGRDDSMLNNVTNATLKKIAENTNVEVVKYTLPNKNVATGELDTIDDLITLCKDLKAAYHDLFEFNPDTDTESVNEAISNFKRNMENVSGNIAAINFTGSEETVTMNAAKYLQEEREWLNVVGQQKIEVNNLTASKKLYDLRSEMMSVRSEANDINPEKTNKEMFAEAQSMAAKLKGLVVDLMKKISSAYNTYWTMALEDLDQMYNVSINLGKIGNKSESAIFESEYYQNSPELQEFMFGRDTTIDESVVFAEFYQAIDDTNTRMSIYRHRTEMKAMNEEALIFAETGISDYEKFQRLQAVNEALGNKIKKAYYNTVAALKEIFRKFMEKLTANFTPTKTYLDRYKKIILGTPFNNYELKIQDMPTAIERIERATVPQLNYNALAQQAPDFGTFFGEVKKDLPENGDPKIKQSDVQTVGDANEWFKSYFCMQDHELNTNGKWFQQNVKNFYDFLYDINKINKSIRDSLKSIDDTVTSITKTAGSTQQEAVYSILYQKWFTLNENGVLVEVEVKAPENPAAPQGGQQQQTGEQTPANKVQNIKQNDDADNSNAKNDARGDVEARLKIYTDVCSSLLKAKMSAVEFVRNELMTVIRKHVQDHINANPQQQQDQQQNQDDQQQQSQQTQQQPAKRPNVIQRAGNAVRAGANAFRGR